MKFNNIIYPAILLLALSSCQKDIVVPEPDLSGFNTSIAEIDPSVYVNDGIFASAPGTKSLVDKNTAVTINSNFIRVDEIIDADGNGTYTFKPWSEALVIEGKAATSDNSTNSLRALTLIPTQTYRIKGEKISEDKFRIDNYYHTRMIGWYPQTCTLGTNANGNKITTDISAARNSQGESIYSVKDGRTFIHFSNLGIDKDLMMTDMREGQQWHTADSNPASDSFKGSSVYREPFGYYTGNPSYSNFFTFHHYRSAIRLYAEAEQSDQNLAMWGTILNVRIINQPTACSIRLPEKVDSCASYAKGDIIWDVNSKADFSIMKDAMFSGSPDRESLNQTVEYPIELDGATSASRVYLGYALVQPNQPVDIELQTTSGIYSVTLKNTVVDKVTNDTTSCLNPGVFYNVTLSLQTTGAITEVLESRDDEVYYDLSKEETLEGEAVTTGLRYANSYIVDPKSSLVTDALSRYLTKVNADADDSHKVSKTRYDGFAFCATVIGNGEAGRISNNFVPSKTTISPYSARLIWETSMDLITNVELIHGYVRFKVKYTDSGNTTQKGNALIGVYDKDNKLLWSWHVWVTDSPSEVTVNGNKFLDRNIGATVAVPNNNDNALLSYGLYYQWGRKDPSMYPPSYNYPVKSLLTSTYYDHASEEKKSFDVRQYSQPTLEDAIAYPQFLILPTGRTGGNYAYNWSYDNYTDLWGYSSADQSVTKTIYDPCPYGYRVPGNELKAAVDVMYQNNATKNGYGWSYNQFFLPYTGFKGEDRNSNSVVCSWLDVGKRGDYQTAEVSNSDGTRFHRGRVFISKEQTWSYYIGDVQQSYGNTSAYYQADYTNRRTAAPVRCVKDENMAGTITTSINISSAGSNNKLVAGDLLTITYSANTTGNTILTTMSLNLVYSVNGVPQKKVLASTASGLGSSSTKTFRYTVGDIAELSEILESGYTFTVEAKNNIGRSSSSNAQMTRDVYTIDGINSETINTMVSKKVQVTALSGGNTLAEGIVLYTSSNPSVATVSQTGLVTAVGVGTTTITATVPTTATYTGVGSATCTVNVAEYTAPKLAFLFGGEGDASNDANDWYNGLSSEGVTVGTNITFVWYVHFDDADSNNSSKISINGGTPVEGSRSGGTITVDDLEYVRFTYTYSNNLAAGSYRASFSASSAGGDTINETKQFIVKNKTTYPVDYKYWIKATSIDDIKDKEVVIIYHYTDWQHNENRNHDRILRNTSNNTNQLEVDVTCKIFSGEHEFNPGRQFYPNYSFIARVNNGKVKFVSTTDEKYMYMGQYYTSGFQNNDQENDFNVAFNNGACTIGRSGLYLRHWGGNVQAQAEGSSFEIWYKSDYVGKTYTIQHTYNNWDRYVADQDSKNDGSTLKILSKLTNKSNHIWLVVEETAKNNFILYNTTTGRYISAAGNENINNISTSKTRSNAKPVIVDLSNSNAQVIQSGSHYWNNYGGLNVTNYTIGLWQNNDNHRFKVTEI